MKKIASLFLLAMFVLGSFYVSAEAKTSHIKGYKKKNGTYVNSHYKHTKTYKRKSSYKRKR